MAVLSYSGVRKKTQKHSVLTLIAQDSFCFCISIIYCFQFVEFWQPGKIIKWRSLTMHMTASEW